MKITLGLARRQLAGYVGEGHSPEEQIVVDAINEATNWLIPKVKGGYIFCRYSFNITGNIITLPRECISLIKLRVNNEISHINNRWFEFIGYGTGGLDYGGGYWCDVAYMGRGFPTITNLSRPSKLLVYSEIEEPSKFITIIGYDENGKRIEEKLKIQKTEPFYTQSSFIKIEAIEKDMTEGYVYLSSFDSSTNDRINLGVYAPSETNPSYTRYYIRGGGNAQQGTGIVRLGYIPVYKDTEPLIIQNLPALSLMLKALHNYKTGDIQKAQAYEMNAIRLLDEQIEAEEPLSNTIEFSSASMLWNNEIDI